MALVLGHHWWLIIQWINAIPVKNIVSLRRLLNYVANTKYATCLQILLVLKKSVSRIIAQTFKKYVWYNENITNYITRYLTQFKPNKMPCTDSAKKWSFPKAADSDQFWEFNCAEVPLLDPLCNCSSDLFRCNAEPWNWADATSRLEDQESTSSGD